MVHSFSASFLLEAERANLSVKLPKLNVAIDNELLSHFDRLCIIGADQGNRVIEVPVITDKIGAVFGQRRNTSYGQGKAKSGGVCEAS